MSQDFKEIHPNFYFTEKDLDIDKYYFTDIYFYEHNQMFFDMSKNTLKINNSTVLSHIVSIGKELEPCLVKAIHPSNGKEVVSLRYITLSKKDNTGDSIAVQQYAYTDNNEVPINIFPVKKNDTLYFQENDDIFIIHSILKRDSDLQDASQLNLQEIRKFLVYKFR